MKPVLAGVMVLAASLACANEPIDEMQLSAEARRPDVIRGTVDVRVGVALSTSDGDVDLLVLDASRSPWPGVERVDGSTLRVPLTQPGVHQVIIRATATVHGRALATEAVVRVAYKVPEPIVDDGTHAVFAMEPGR